MNPSRSLDPTEYLSRLPPVCFGLERGKSNHIRFTLTVKEGENISLEKRLAALDQSVKNLFWKEVSTSVVLNGKKVFDSTPQEDIKVGKA